MTGVAPWLPPSGQELSYAGLVTVAAAGAVIRARAGAGPRAPWLLLAAGMAVGALCSFGWAICYLVGAPLTGFSALDVLYFCMYLLVAAAVFAHANGPSSTLAGVAEGGVVGLTGAVLGWFFLYDPLISDTRGWSGGTAALAYPVLDLILVASAVRLLAVAGRATVTYVFVLLAFAAMVSADVV